jgi:hypothetical protein
MITINPSSSVIIYVMTATNKRLLISESHGDSNWCTPCRGKPNQHDMYAFHASPRTPAYASCRQSPYVATFREVFNNDEQSHCSREKGLSTQSSAHRLIDPWVHTQFLSWASHWSSGGKATLCRQLATRLTKPISPTCDQYVQYLLAGGNPLVLNWHRRELQP